jgi:hypothetical protein
MVPQDGLSYNQNWHYPTFSLTGLTWSNPPHQLSDSPHPAAAAWLSFRRASIHGDRLQERLVGVSEADIQQKRALLVEGRKWIFAMLDETTAMLRQLDEASLKAGAAD